jgi:D-psicose/D-tagatose/L-ribulose 3-epimerase
MKLGMNMLLWASHVTEAHYPIFEKIKKAGFDGVELPLFEGDAAHFTAIGAELARQGLGCTTVTCLSTDANPISEDAKVRQAGLDRIKWALDMTACLKGDVLAGPYHSALGHFSGNPPTTDEKHRAVEVLRAAAVHAQSVNVKMAIEYLNRFECYFVTTARQMAELVDAVNHPWFRCMYDTFHAHIEEKGQAEAIAALAPRFIHVHLSENDRGVPGTGQVRWEETFSALKKINYQGWMTIEAFGRALPDLAAATKVWRDLYAHADDVYIEGGRFLRDGWAKAQA